MLHLAEELIILQDEGPLELTRRQNVLVWNDEFESTHEMFKPEEEDRHESEDPFEDPEDRPSSPHASINTMPLPTPTTRLNFAKQRPQIIPGPARRSADFLKFSRPVSFSTTYSKVHPGTTGVAVLEQMERLDAVEASLKKLGGGVDGDNPKVVDPEMDVAESSIHTSTRNRPPGPTPAPGRISRSSSSHTHTYSDCDVVPPMMTASFSGVSDGLPAVVEAPSSNASEVGDEDLAHMSKSMSYMDARPSLHSRWMSQDGDRPRLDWIIDEGEAPKPKTVIVEVRTLHSRVVRQRTDHYRFVAANRNRRCQTLLFLVKRVDEPLDIGPLCGMVRRSMAISYRSILRINPTFSLHVTSCAYRFLHATYTLPKKIRTTFCWDDVRIREPFAVLPIHEFRLRPKNGMRM